MNLEITEDPPAALKTYASVPSTLVVREVFDVAVAHDDPLGVRLVACSGQSIGLPIRSCRRKANCSGSRSLQRAGRWAGEVRGDP
jgi:hypothetical protein